MALLSFPSQPRLHFKQTLELPASARVCYPSSVWSTDMFRGSGSAALCVTLTSEVGTLGPAFIFMPFDGKKC